MEGYLLSEDDRKILKQIAEEFRTRHKVRPNFPGDQSIDHDEQMVPEVYFALTPASGIAAMSGVQPGVANCLIYRILSGVLQQVGLTKYNVYNTGAGPIAGNLYVPIWRDKFGSWFAYDLTAASCQTPKVTCASLVYQGAPQGGLINRQVFKVAGTYTYNPINPSATTSVLFEPVGAGGGGSGVASPGGGNVAIGGGGNGGTFGSVLLTSGFAGATLVVGAKGTGGAAGNNPGTNGNASSITLINSTVYSVPGGSGGGNTGAVVAPFFVNNNHGTNGSDSANFDIERGPWGANEGVATSSSSGYSGPGGNSQYGSGGPSADVNSANTSSAGVNAVGSGGGGSGAMAVGTGVAAKGGDGTDGLIIAWEFGNLSSGKGFHGLGFDLQVQYEDPRDCSTYCLNDPAQCCSGTSTATPNVPQGGCNWSCVNLPATMVVSASSALNGGASGPTSITASNIAFSCGVWAGSSPNGPTAGEIRLHPDGTATVEVSTSSGAATYTFAWTPYDCCGPWTATQVFSGIAGAPATITVTPNCSGGGSVSRANLGTASQLSAVGIATGSVTLPANALLVVVLEEIDNGGHGFPVLPTVLWAGNAMTNRLSKTNSTGTYPIRVSEWTYFTATGGAGPISANAGITNYSWILAAVEVLGLTGDTEACQGASSGSTANPVVTAGTSTGTSVCYVQAALGVDNPVGSAAMSGGFTLGQSASLLVGADTYWLYEGYKVESAVETPSTTFTLSSTTQWSAILQGSK